MTIGIFIIATDKYIDFCYPLCEGLKKYFLKDYEKSVYIFTDSKKNPSNTIRVYQKHKPFPYPTLFRYHIISNFCNKNKIQHDYYYYIDADMIIIDKVGDEILGNIVATIHPGFYNIDKNKLYYEKKFLSTSYISPNKITNYFAGGFNGGKNYIDMANKIKNWIDIDQKYNYVPRWHDESYLNKFMAINKPDIKLSPAYCYPDNISDIKKWGLISIKPKILAVTKLK